MLFGCQTLPSYKKPLIPAIFLDKFETCAPSEGGGFLTLNVREGSSISSEIEWIYNQRFRARLLSPLGQTLARFSSNDHVVRVAGKLSSRFPKIALDEKGFILLDGRWIALKLDELACFLKGKWPYDWLSMVTSSQSGRDSLLLTFEEKNRSFSLHLRSGGYQSGQSCARIMWNAFWFFSEQELQVCFSSHKPRLMMKISGYSLMVDRDE